MDTFALFAFTATLFSKLFTSYHLRGYYHFQMPINPNDQINGMKAFGKSYGPHGPAAPAMGKSLKSVSSPFKQDSAGKLNRSGASTRSESLARLRGKGALA